LGEIKVPVSVLTASK